MIRLSNGHSFQFMVASGALGFDGRGWPWEWPLRWVGRLDPTLFTVVTKTLTLKPRRGNLRWLHPWSVVKRLPRDGVVNAVGLTNPGIDWWIREVAPRLDCRVSFIVSIEADAEDEMTAMLAKLAGISVQGVELNLSCPNSPGSEALTVEKILSLCRKACRLSAHPLIAKLSYTHEWHAIGEALHRERTDYGRIEALSINSVPWSCCFSDRPSPLSRFGGGGVSGKAAQPWTWRMVEGLASLAVRGGVPVIGPSVWDLGDIDHLFRMGAAAVSFGSIFLTHPWRPTRLVKDWVSCHPEVRTT